MTFEHMHLRFFFQPQDAIFELENAFSSGFLGLLRSSDQEHMQSVEIGAKLWLLFQSRNCLGAGHRRVRYFKTMQESFPKTIPLWSPKNYVPM